MRNSFFIFSLDSANILLLHKVKINSLYWYHLSRRENIVWQFGDYFPEIIPCTKKEDNKIMLTNHNTNKGKSNGL